MGTPNAAVLLERARPWEFWPPWLFYAPVAVRVAFLMARHGPSALAAANPGLPDGGLVGESKFAILRSLPADATIPSLLVPAGTGDDRSSAACQAVAAHGWRYPLVLKPDVGQRGVGVRRVANAAELVAYVRRHAWAIVMQPWHAGPREAGIFYWRMPGADRGRIFSITDKVFPFVAGDGRSTLAALVERHPRFRRQAAVFLRRHAACRNIVVPRGTTVRLGEVGNHAQGTLFRDGVHLLTPALEQRVDAIARRVPGFFVGRFDVRYADVERFKAGEDLAIVELNGVTAESTNIYDPSRSLLAAYRTLFAQWDLVFRIGAANRALGMARTPGRRLLQLAWSHLRDRRVFPVSS